MSEEDIVDAARATAEQAANLPSKKPVGKRKKLLKENCCHSAVGCHLNNKFQFRGRVYHA